MTPRLHQETVFLESKRVIIVIKDVNIVHRGVR